MAQGSNLGRPTLLELECAEELLKMIDGAEMVKFAKNGSDVTSAAVKLARAYTGREMVGICTSQPFFSVDDWYIGSTPMDAGIPQCFRDLTVGFQFNDLGSVERLFEAYPGQIACLILEPDKGDDPKDRFLHRVQEICRREGAVFILDEIITGFRWHPGGAQAYHGITPDLSTFGKGMGNGFSVSALAGRRELMKLGGIDHGKERVFLLSATHGAEGHCLAAGLEVMRFYQEFPVIETLWRKGRRLRELVTQVISRHHLEEFFSVDGKPPCLVYGTRDLAGKPSQEFRTLFLQETIRRGILAPSFVISYAHSDEDIKRTVDAVDGALSVYAKALESGIENYLEGRPVKPVWRKYN
jgi:glutamate-1-semialdehyde 2,1-aminomutase